MSFVTKTQTSVHFSVGETTQLIHQNTEEQTHKQTKNETTAKKVNLKKIKRNKISH